MGNSYYKYIVYKENRDRFTDLSLNNNKIDGRLIAFNNNYLAMSWTNGDIVLLNSSKPCKITKDQPRMKYNYNKSNDIEFSPFNNKILASTYDNNYAVLWKIPDGDLKENITKELQIYTKHTKKTTYITFNPIVNNVLCSGSLGGEIHIWNPEKGDNYIEFKSDDSPSMISWNPNGNLVGVTTKNRYINIFDPRNNKIILRQNINDGVVSPKFGWIDNDLFVTTGYDNKKSKHMLKLWDIRNHNNNFLNEGELASIQIDKSKSDIFTPFINKELKIIYILGKEKSSFNAYIYNNRKLEKIKTDDTKTPSICSVLLDRKYLNKKGSEIDTFLNVTKDYKNIYYSSVVYSPKNNKPINSLKLFPEENNIALSFEEWIEGKNIEKKGDKQEIVNKNDFKIKEKDKEVIILDVKENKGKKIETKNKEEREKSGELNTQNPIKKALIEENDKNEKLIKENKPNIKEINEKQKLYEELNKKYLDIKNKYEDLNKSYLEEQKKVKKLNDDQNNIDNLNKELKQKYEEENKDLKQKSEKEIENLKKEIEKLKEELKGEKDKNKQLTFEKDNYLKEKNNKGKLNKDLETKLKEEQDKNKQLNENYEKFLEEKKIYEKLINNNKNIIEEKSKLYDELTKKYEEEKKKNEQLNIDLKNNKNETLINELQGKLSENEKTINDLTQNLEKEKNEKKELSEKNELLNKEKEEFEKIKSELNRNLDKEKEKYKNLDEEYKKYLEDKNNNTKLCEDLKQKYEKENNDLKEKSENLNNELNKEKANNENLNKELKEEKDKNEKYEKQKKDLEDKLKEEQNKNKQLNENNEQKNLEEKNKYDELKAKYEQLDNDYKEKDKLYKDSNKKLEEEKNKNIKLNNDLKHYFHFHLY